MLQDHRAKLHHDVYFYCEATMLYVGILLNRYYILFSNFVSQYQPSFKMNHELICPAKLVEK